MNYFLNNFFLFVSGCLLLSGCSFRSVSKSKNIVYNPEHQLQLNVFSPKKISNPKEVFVFIHGGNWQRGKKSIYNFLGKRMAKKNIVTVIIDYRKYPLAAYKEMTSDAASSIKWVKQNISTYGGDTNKIYISGHSAGGHLAALVATDEQYFNALNMKNPVKGVILIDAFGLDMYNYLMKEDNYKKEVYHSVFTKDPDTWKKASPIYHLHKDMPPFMIYVGGKTYPNIIKGSNDFLVPLKKYQASAGIITVKGARHIPMIFNFLNPRKKAYKEIIDFMSN